jgi:hypothetical protein
MLTPSQHRRRLQFAFIVTSLAMCGLTAALGYGAQGGIVYNALYDCGPGRNQFKVLNCNGSLCTLLYPKGNGGAGFKTTIDRESLAESINGTYGGTRKPCTINGKVVKAPTQAALNPLAPKKPQPPNPGGPMVTGRYECWTYTGGHLEAAMMENFSLAGGGQYKDAGGHAGTYAVSSGLITFRGAALNGVQARYIQGVPGSANPPHIQFLGSRGSGDECDGKG